MIYFDNSSTTRPSVGVINAVNTAMSECFANASSLHIEGVTAHKVIDEAKKIIARSLGCTPMEILLGSGGTFCNNLAVSSAAASLKRRGKKIVISSIEHPSVSECAMSFKDVGFDVVMCDPTKSDFEREIDENTVLVSCMMVNNETGLILPVDKLKRIITAKKSPALLHIDAVQAYGKIPVNVKKLNADFVTVSAHKINGPKGIGALYVKKGTRVIPLVRGGEQEGGIVPGTYNVPAIAGFSTAVKEMLERDNSCFDLLYDRFVSRVSEFDFIKLNQFGEHAHHIINVSFDGYLGENVLHFLESKGIFVSQGSACSSHSKQKSKTIVALGGDKKTADGSIRVSFDHNNTTDEIDAFFDVCSQIPDKLIRLYK